MDMNRETFKISSAIFRIYVAFHILKKYIFYFFNKEMLFGNDSFIAHHDDFLIKMLGLNTVLIRDNIGVLITIILLLSLLLAFGIGKKLTCILLFIAIELIQRLNGLILNGGDNLLKFILLYMCFINSYDYLVTKISKNTKLSIFISNLAILCIKIHLCLIYFISAISKIHSDVWFNGIANYYILAVERFSTIADDDLFINKNYIAITFTTYITLFWELSFPYLIWIKKFKNLFIFIGILIHLSIYKFMMIHDFEILFISTYVLFYNDNEIKDYYNLFKQKAFYVQSRLFAKSY